MLSVLAPLVFLSAFLRGVIGQNGPSNWTALPFNPPALPLAVRSPYLNVWLPQGNNPSAAYNVDNTIWDYSQAVQWYTSVVVDNKEYRLLSPWAQGEATADQKAVEFTTTRTSFLMLAGGVQFNMTFLSPIEPNNFTVQSLPFTYMYLTAHSIDGQAHRVRMYSDIEGNIAAGDVHQTIEWSAEDSDNYVVLSTRLQNQKQFVENNVQAQDATVYYSFKKIKGFTTSWQISGFNSARGLLFSNPTNGNLNNSADSRFRPPSTGDDTPVFAISIDWGNITSTPEPAVWSLGVCRNPSIQYLTPDGAFQFRSPYFMSTLSNPIDAPKYVLDDFPRALNAAVALDARIRSDGGAISSEYADLLALSARQAMGTMDITIPPPSKDGKWDTSDVKIFMKNIGSIGSDNQTITSVNNVDALYAAFPAFLYLNPDIGGYLLAPLLEYQDSRAYTLPYAAKNIGTGYSSAVANGINDPHIFGVDETAGMIIMTLAYSLASGNGTLISKHYGLLRRWAEYLSNNAITPFNQSSGDLSVNSDFVSANQTNLALKGIIGIAAMAKIAEAAGVADDRDKFSAIAQGAIDFWQKEAISSSTVNFLYGAADTNGLMYNLYADKLLRLNLVPDAVYTTCTSFYQTAAGKFKYGIPLNSSPSQNTSTNWMLFTASTVKSNATRDALVSQVHGYASNNLNNAPFTSIYNPSTGRGGPGSGAGRASPAQGGMFALLALGTTSKTISVPILTPSSGSPPRSRAAFAGLVAGATIGSLLVTGCCVALGIFFYRRRKLKHKQAMEENMGEVIEPYLTPPAISHDGYSGLPGGSTTLSYGSPGSIRSSSEVLTLSTGGRWDAKSRPATEAQDNSRFMRMMTRIHELESQEGESSDGRSRSDIVESLRHELNSLRRDVEQIRQERSFIEEAPPSYSD